MPPNYTFHITEILSWHASMKRAQKIIHLLPKFCKQGKAGTLLRIFRIFIVTLFTNALSNRRINISTQILLGLKDLLVPWFLKEKETHTSDWIRTTSRCLTCNQLSMGDIPSLLFKLCKYQLTFANLGGMPNFYPVPPHHTGRWWQRWGGLGLRVQVSPESPVADSLPRPSHCW